MPLIGCFFAGSLLHATGPSSTDGLGLVSASQTGSMDFLRALFAWSFLADTDERRSCLAVDNPSTESSATIVSHAPFSDDDDDPSS